MRIHLLAGLCGSRKKIGCPDRCTRRRTALWLRSLRAAPSSPCAWILPLPAVRNRSRSWHDPRWTADRNSDHRKTSDACRWRWARTALLRRDTKPAACSSWLLHHGPLNHIAPRSAGMAAVKCFGIKNSIPFASNSRRAYSTTLQLCFTNTIFPATVTITIASRSRFAKPAEKGTAFNKCGPKIWTGVLDRDGATMAHHNSIVLQNRHCNWTKDAFETLWLVAPLRFASSRRVTARAAGSTCADSGLG
jgi:hypothetical protein